MSIGTTHMHMTKIDVRSFAIAHWEEPIDTCSRLWQSMSTKSNIYFFRLLQQSSKQSRLVLDRAPSSWNTWHFFYHKSSRNITRTFMFVLEIVSLTRKKKIHVQYATNILISFDWLVHEHVCCLRSVCIECSENNQFKDLRSLYYLNMRNRSVASRCYVSTLTWLTRQNE
jgi:hypothetical protein